MSTEEAIQAYDRVNHTQEKKEAQKIAKAISEYMIIHNIGYNMDELGYFPEKVLSAFDHQFSAEELKLFGIYFDLHDPSNVYQEQYVDKCAFPNTLMFTRFGVVFDLMFGQGTSISLYPELSFDKFRMWIGQQVRKARKPFKSGLKVNTVKGMILHPQLWVPAFTFVEDDSYVRCDICSLV